MDKLEAETLVRNLFEQHGLVDWSFCWNQNKHLLGLCKYVGRIIELSEPYVSHNSRAHVLDTILHEIAHALAGREAHHGPRWKEVAMRLGAHPRACARDAAMPQGRWLARCPGCAREFQYHRKPRYIRSRYCRRCGPVAGKLVFRDNLKPVQVPPVKRAPGEKLPAQQVLFTPDWKAVAQLQIVFPVEFR